MNMIDAHRLIDLEAPMQLPESGGWVVYEQLYPESRGKMPHRFASEEAAQRFYKTGEGTECE